MSVEVYSGSRYAERPTVVEWQGERLPVAQLLREWRTPDGPGFEVVLTAGQRLRLQYNEAADLWTVLEIA